MSRIAAMLAAFHALLGDERGRGGAALRLALHEEESEELLEELRIRHTYAPGFRERGDHEVDRAKLARELADVVYVAFGTAHAFDIDLDAALAEVHRAAMSKLDPPCIFCEGNEDEANPPGIVCAHCGGTGKGQRVVRDDGKVLRPPGFVPPDMLKAVGSRSPGRAEVDD